MKLEQPHFSVGHLYGFDQEQYPDLIMNKGGCAATVACESCILLKKYFGISSLYPYDENNVTFDDFNRFAMTMKPYLRPRLMGINKLSMYADGFSEYLAGLGETRVAMELIEGSGTDYETAAAFLVKQLDSGLPVPFLMLNHKDKTLDDFIWHWFLLNGYELTDALRVKVCSYGEWVWLDFKRLWDTGYDEKGGMIFYRIAASLSPGN